MTLPIFQNALLQNFEKHRGPFNWLASEFDLAVYSSLSSTEKKMAMEIVYSRYAQTISKLTEKTSPIEKILCRPVRFQDIFELIVSTTLIGFLKDGGGNIRFCVGDCLLPESYEDTSWLKHQFQVFESSLSTSKDLWICDLRSAWGSSAILTWAESQVAFLELRLKSISNALNKNSPVQKDDERPKKDSTDPFSVAACDVRDSLPLSLEEATADLEKLVGLTDMKKRLCGLIARAAYSEARSIACDTVETPSFNNFIISGPPGVGKTTSARLIGGLLAASGLVRSKTIVQTTTSGLIGVYTGTTEAKVTDLFNRGRGGVIIIDEADALAPQHAWTTCKFYEAAIDTLNALIGYEKDNDTRTIVILTGYETGIQTLLNQNLGLRRRFPNHIVIPSYGAVTLKGILCQMLEARHYKFEPQILDALLEQILAAKAHLADTFGNAGAVEEFISVMEAGRAERIGLSNLRQIIFDKAVNTEMAARLSELAINDIPKFDKAAKIFRPDYLYLVESRD